MLFRSLDLPSYYYFWSHGLLLILNSATDGDAIRAVITLVYQVDPLQVGP